MPTYNHPGTLGTRVRKNAKNLSPEEWNRFVNALKVMKMRTRAGGVVSIYDEFSAMHMGGVEMNRAWRRAHPQAPRNEMGTADPAHDNPGFLPWHRQFLREFESALQAIDPSVTLPYWDWTDHAFSKRFFASAMMGGNGGRDGSGGAVVNGPFTLHEGWSSNTALHRPSWFLPLSPSEPTDRDPPEESDLTTMQQASLGRSVVRYLGDFEDLATSADIIEFTKRKAIFGPDKLVIRSDIVETVPDATDETRDASNLPRGTLHIGESLPTSALPSAQVAPGERSIDGYDACDKVLTTGDNVLLALREIVPGFRWSTEAGPHMHNQTHDWFGFHTTILQDDQLIGASTMTNVACASVDPMFFLHHCNVDRIWAEWQDSGHYGPIFYPKRSDALWLYADMESALNGNPMHQYTYPDGHNLDDNMWPWDDGATQTQRELQSMIPCFPYTLCARDALDYRLLGYCYDTSTRLSVNSVTPVVVHLPATRNERTHQVFPLHIQREGRYLIAARNIGPDRANLTIKVYRNYEEVFEQTFMKDGFKGESVPMESDEDRTQAATSFVWSLQRGSYYVVASAIILEDENDMTKRPAVDAVYEIGVATSPVFDLIAVPMAPGIIGDPQVPPESCVYIPSRRYAPIKLEEGVPQFRLTQMKGTHELFGINVSRSAGFLDIRFEGMDALVQIYGPFDLNNDHLPHFDTDGEPIKGDTLAQLNSRLQIASSEGCCKRLGSGISSVVTAGRYIVLVFHCSIGHNEHRPYKVRYTFDATIKIRSLELDRMEVAEPGSGRAVNQLYRVSAKDGQPLVTQNGDIYKVNVATDDPRTQSQVRVVVFAYSSRDVLREPDEEPGQYVTYNSAFWGESTLTFDVVEDQILFVRVSILNGYQETKVKTSIQKW